jgi:uncharacterized membrane protein YfcA
MESFNLTILMGILLFLAAFAAGFIDSVAGGGGLITVPVLMGIGLPPQMALGTNKFQSSFGSFSAMANYAGNGHIPWNGGVLTGVISTLVGAAAGAVIVQMVDPRWLSLTIPWLLGAIFLYLLFKPDLGEKDHVPHLKPVPMFIVCGLSLGFYDGFFGPGTGNFWALALVLLGGMNLVRATAHTKLMNFTSNIVSLLIFLWGGNIRFDIGLIMGVGQFTGGLAGSGMVMKKGVRFIRPVFMTVVLVMVLYLMAKNYGYL